MIFPFTALEVVLTGRSPHTPRFRFETSRDREFALDCLESVGVIHLAARPVTELSGGERQLVALARALAQEPECLLLDEPASSLDLKHRWQIIRILRRLRTDRGVATLLVTHELDMLDESFDLVVAMRNGVVIHSGPPNTVIRADVLRQVYADGSVQAARFEGRTFVWSQASS
jgi:iron complex transport system ATP-binding protein